jgi:hypothetical protein
MRSRWKAYVAAPLIALGCTEGSGLDPELEELVLAFCSSEMPVWFAFQNEGDSWTRVQPDANNAFVFDASDKVAIAATFDFGTSRLTDVYYAHIDELRPLSNKACTETVGTKTVNGTVAGVGISETARISMSSRSTTATSLNSGWTLTNVANSAQDLIAVRGIGTAGVPNRVIVRRAENPVSGATLSSLNFGATEALAIATNTLTISGLLSSESNYYDIDVMTATGTSHLLFQSPDFTSPSQTLYGIPTSITQSGDRHRIDLNADGASSYRTVRHWYRNPADKTLAFGAALNIPTLQSVNSTSTSYVRLRTTLASQVDYQDFVTAYFTQSTREVYITVTAGFNSGTPGTWVNEIPDFSTAGGYPDNAGLQTSSATQWSVEAFDGTLENYIGAAPIDGATVKFAGRANNTSTFQMRVAGEPQRPRVALERRAFRQ